MAFAKQGVAGELYADGIGLVGVTLISYDRYSAQSERIASGGEKCGGKVGVEDA